MENREICLPIGLETGLGTGQGGIVPAGELCAFFIAVQGAKASYRYDAANAFAMLIIILQL
jgi:hypothetical protein